MINGGTALAGQFNFLERFVPDRPETILNVKALLHATGQGRFKPFNEFIDFVHPRLT